MFSADFINTSMLVLELIVLSIASFQLIQMGRGLMMHFSGLNFSSAERVSHIGPSRKNSVRSNSARRKTRKPYSKSIFGGSVFRSGTGFEVGASVLVPSRKDYLKKQLLMR